MPDPRAAFESRVMRHLDAAYGLARRYLGAGADAEDAVQDACIQAHRAFGAFRGDDAKPWLLQIVRRVCLRSLERRRKAPDQIPEDAEIAYTGDLGDPQASVLRAADIETVRLALDRLPEPFRETLVLRELEELSYAEIGEVMGVPEGTVMSRLSRARALLAADLRRSAAQEERN